MRVVPNKYPALAGSAGRHEVVVHTPRHVLSLADLSPAELASVVSAWEARAGVARSQGFPYVHVLVNEGRAAGGSRLHTHSQLVWLPQEPPAVVDERKGAVSCSLCALLAEERSLGSRVVLDRDGVVVLAAFAGRAPYELLVAPVQCESEAFGSTALLTAVTLLSEVVRRLRQVEPGAPLNVWLHTFPSGDGHWHLEVVPRLTVFAGLELGAGLYVNPLSPETAADRLRSAPPA